MARRILQEVKSRSALVRVALYARVSTLNNGQDPKMQTRELREYCKHRGWKVCGEYVDEGISGAKDNRPELNKLMHDAHRRRFDAVVVWRFDRFARSVSHLLRALENFKALGVEFVSLSEQVDTSTPTGKMVFTVLGAVAELERSLIAERVKAGLRNARAKGIRLGRPRVHVNATTVATLRAQGRSWRDLTAEMGISKGSAQRAYWGLPKNFKLPKSLLRGTRNDAGAGVAHI
jgi:DNA invertase Pin-like site-specific DNA recombinase